ncbi:MAG: radical SAM protein [Magnetococcales bacterium]|nr:radical SAM protein [Magnetococcales bacterium]
MTTMPKKDIGGSKLQSYPEHFQAWLDGKNPGPLVAEIGVVNGCNHNCLHCDFQMFEPYGKHNKYLDFEVFKKFAIDFANMGGVEFFFAGSGEPLLHPKLPEIISFAKSLGINCTMSSNGQLLTKTNAEKILPHLDWIRFSVNGGDSKTYAKIHDCRSIEFERLEKNLSDGVNIRNSEGYNAQFILQYIIYDLNIDSIPGIVDLHNRVGTDKLLFRNRIDKVSNENSVPQHILEQILEIEKEQEKVEVRCSNNQNKPETPTWSKCYGPNFRIYLESSGNIIPCSRDFYIDSKIGNINQTSFKDIWHSNKRETIYSEIATGKDISICGKFCQVSFDNIYVQGWLEKNSPDWQKK